MSNCFHTLKVECLHRHRFATRDEAKAVIARYIESFYNNRRLHSGIGYQTPQQAMQNVQSAVH
ncbi:MAG: IS3 family transposase [Rhodanobacteraceae bacterium]|nr:IS3 family transposase [Rhodanobacteraceae bacterium]